MSPVTLAPPELTQSTRYSDGVEQKHIATGGGGGGGGGHRNYNYQGLTLTFPELLARRTRLREQCSRVVLEIAVAFIPLVVIVLFFGQRPRRGR